MFVYRPKDEQLGDTTQSTVLHYLAKVISLKYDSEIIGCVKYLTEQCVIMKYEKVATIWSKSEKQWHSAVRLSLL